MSSRGPSTDTTGESSPTRERRQLFRLAERVEIGDFPPHLRGAVEDIFFMSGPALGPSIPCWVVHTAGEESAAFSSAIHGRDIETDSVEEFESQFLPFVLDRHECSLVRVHYEGAYNETWIYLRGETVEEAGQTALAFAVLGT